MSYRKAAKLMGKGDSQYAAQWVKTRVQEGKIRCEHMSRQMHVFSIRLFPKAASSKIAPKGAQVNVSDLRLSFLTLPQ